MKMKNAKSQLHQINFRYFNASMTRDGHCNTSMTQDGTLITIAPLGPPKSVHMDDDDLVACQDPYWASRMISQEWSQIIPKGATGVSASLVFSKKEWAYMGIQFYFVGTADYVSNDLFESEFTQFEKMKGGLESLLITPLQSLSEKVESLRNGCYDSVDTKIYHKSLSVMKPLALEIGMDGQARCKLIPFWRLVPVGLPLVVEMPHRASHDIWGDFDKFLEKQASEILPPEAHAYCSERTVHSPSGIGHIRTLQPYRILSENDSIPIAYLERLKELNGSLKRKIASLNTSTIEELLKLPSGD